MEQVTTTPGEKVLASPDEAHEAEKSVRASSRKNAGGDMSDVLPAGEMLNILMDHLLKLQEGGFKVEYAALPGKTAGVAFILYGVKKQDGKLVPAVQE